MCVWSCGVLVHDSYMNPYLLTLVLVHGENFTFQVLCSFVLYSLITILLLLYRTSACVYHIFLALILGGDGRVVLDFLTNILEIVVVEGQLYYGCYICYGLCIYNFCFWLRPRVIMFVVRIFVLQPIAHFMLRVSIQLLIFRRLYNFFECFSQAYIPSSCVVMSPLYLLTLP